MIGFIRSDRIPTNNPCTLKEDDGVTLRFDDVQDKVASRLKNRETERERERAR